MPAYDFRSPRLFVEAPLAAGAALPLDRAQAHYLTTVLRRKPGDGVLVFNGRDGEWGAALAVQKRAAALRRRRQNPRPDRAGRPALSVRAAQIGAAGLHGAEGGRDGRLAAAPVLTRHGQVARVNLERMRANAIEAAEQCGILSLPEIAEPADLTRLLADRDPARTIVFCDEDAEVANPLAALSAVPPHAPLAVLVGPEGGFAEDERAAAAQAAERGPHCPRPAHPARRYGRGGGADDRSGGGGGLGRRTTEDRRRTTEDR